MLSRGRRALLVASVIGSALALAGGEESPEKIYKKTLPSVAMLTVETDSGERFVGSGVVALKDDLVVTAWHLVRDARAVWATFSDGKRVNVTGFVDGVAERDLALLKLEQPVPRRQATLARELPAVASRAYVIGAPKGYGFSISDGLISQIRLVDGFSQFQVSCPISPGNSGGPVLNERGEVVGIASWTKSDAQNVSFAVPIGELSRLNAARSPRSWSELGTTKRPAKARREGALQGTLAETGEGPEQVGTFADLKKHLEESVGKKVTVVVEEGGTRNQYQFTVPNRALK